MKSRAWLAAIIVVFALMGIVRYWKSSDPSASHASGTPGSGAAAAAGSPGASATGAAKPRPPNHVTRLASAVERQAVADRIAASRAERARQAPPRAPSLPGADQDTGHDLERAAPKLKVALAEAIPFLAECYKTGPTDLAGKPRDRRPAVLLTLTGDPDVGTLIGADQLTDPDGKPLDAELEGCLRTTLGSLELPPLDATSDLHLKYSFVIDDD